MDSIGRGLLEGYFYQKLGLKSNGLCGHFFDFGQKLFLNGIVPHFESLSGNSI
jgi:hypothetical protein